MSNLILHRLRRSGRATTKVLGSSPGQPCLFRRAMTMTSTSGSSTNIPPPGPILTFLSPSPSYSRSAAQFLNELFHLPRITGTGVSESKRIERDCLDQMHFGSNSDSSSWDSVACACPSSGTILHFLSISKDKDNESVDTIRSPLHLIAVHGSHSSSPPPSLLPQFSDESYQLALVECRKLLADGISMRQMFPQSDSKNGPTLITSMEARLRGMVLNVMCNVFGRQPNPSWILGRNPTTTRSISPILDLAPTSLEHGNKTGSNNGNDSMSNRHENTGKLRELALPFYPGASSLQTNLSESTLFRPLPGLYQCLTDSDQNESKTKGRRTTDDPGLIFRPLPAADEDLRLSPPSLVFQCKSLEEAQKLVEENLGGSTFKIGWRGHGQLGSLVVNHPSMLGVDIRINEVEGNEWILSSFFDEAQESLLAGSLDELQSTHVVSEGKSNLAKTSTAEDTKTGNGDCWVELRANAKHPTGFLKQFTSSLLSKPARNRVAKPPDIPYE